MKSDFSSYRPQRPLPLFNQNDASRLHDFQPWMHFRLPRVAPQLEILNGDLLGRSDTYGRTSAPAPAPEPSLLPFGVEALAQQRPVNERTRNAANTAARQELLKATPDLQVLRQYSGGGGIGESVNEYYTPREVVRAMYAAYGDLPEQKEPFRVLDLACGIGSILAQAPKDALCVGVELEQTSAAIAQHLLPHATIHHCSAETYLTQSTDPLFDLCCINPPFGPRSAVQDDTSSQHIKHNEHYFLQKAIERVKPGTGMVVALVNLNLAGGESHRLWRHRLSMYGQVLNTIVVPTSAFKAAGAGVTTMILTIRRHDIGVREALGVLTMQQLTRLLDEYEPSHTGFYSGKQVYSRDSQGQFTMHGRYNSYRRLGQSETLNAGRFDQPEYACPLDASDSRLDAIRQHVTERRRTPAPTLSQVLGQISALYGSVFMSEASKAAQTASLLPMASSHASATDGRR